MRGHEQARQRVPDPLTPYRLRTVGIAVRVTWGAVAVLAVLIALPGHPKVHMAPYLAVLGVAAAGALITGVVLPWPRLFELGWGTRTMYAWSVLDIALVTAGVALTGGPSSDLVFTYALTTIFFAASYPRRSQLALFAFTCACYGLLVGLWSAPVSVATVFVRLGVLSLVYVMAAFLSAELAAEMQGHAEARSLAEHRADLLGAVARTASSINTLDDAQVLAGVMDSLVDLGFEVGSISVIEPGTTQYRITHARGLPQDLTDSIQSTDTGMVALVLERQATVVMPDYQTHPLAIPEIKAVGARAVVATPVWVHGTLAAVLVAGSRRTTALPAHGAEVVEILAAHVGRSLEDSQRFEEEQHIAVEMTAASMTDALTGVGNRRRANLLLEGLRPGDALLLIDLDHFKQVNDEHGHAAGDAELASLGAFLRQRVRDKDEVARYGGEEFLVVLKGARDGAMLSAERLLDGWRSLSPRTTFSGGLALHRPTHTATITIGQADAALYAAKRMGRDRVCEYGAESRAPGSGSVGSAARHEAAAR